MMEDDDMEFMIGQKVEHILSKEYLLVLKLGNEQLLCRTKDLREVWIYKFEIKKV